MNTYKGLDYSLGQSNVDKETGIHFGVISVHDVCQAWYDSADSDYGDPHCPECEGEVIDPCDPSVTEEDWNEGKDWVCPTCKKSFWSEDCYPEDPLGWSLDDGEYKAVDCLDTDVMVLSSPYFTYCQFCSPCVPGAGNLNGPMLGCMGVKTYCFGHDWFEDGAPYPVYRVDTGEVVLPE